MNEKTALSITSRQRLRDEIAMQTDRFLSHGGRIDVVHNGLQSSRPIGPVWWEARGSGPVANLGR